MTSAVAVNDLIINYCLSLLLILLIFSAFYGRPV